MRRTRARNQAQQSHCGENRCSNGFPPSFRQWLLLILSRIATADEAEQLAAIGQGVVVFLNLRRSVFRRRFGSYRLKDEFSGGITGLRLIV